MKRPGLIAAFLSLLLTLPSAAQTARLYTSGSGLANSHIHDICQDSRGFIWISTKNGLSRFDGMEFSTFTHDSKKPDAIASNLVRTIYEDSYGTCWVGTSEGLQVFEKEYNTFSRINLEDWSVPDSDQHISSITEIRSRDIDYIVAASSGHGIYVIDARTRKIGHEIQNSINRHLDSQFIYQIYKDSSERLWILSDEGGLTVFDIAGNDICSDIWEEGMDTVANDHFYSFTEDPVNGNIILSTSNHGILIFDSSTGRMRKARGKGTEMYKVHSMIPNRIAPQYGTHTFLAGLENNGIKLFDADREEIVDVKFPNVSYNMSDWKVQKLFEDKQGNIWAGAVQTGVMVIPKSMFGFEHVELGKPSEDKDNSFCVTSVLSDEKRGSLWVGTDGKGLYEIDSKGKSRNLSAENSALSNNSVMSIALDKRGKLWVATYLGGLLSYTPAEGFRQFRDQKSLKNDKVYCLEYSADDDILYAGTHGNGLSMIDLKEEKVVRTWEEDDNKWISTLYLDSSGLLWVGTYNGPMAYDKRIDRLTVYDLADDKSTRVFAFYESSEGDIWIGTGEGLVCMERSSHDKRLYTEDDGLPCNSVTNIMEDDQGYLWISTLNGLSRMDKRNSTFMNFYHHDGLQENEFHEHAAFKASDGKMYFGGIKGLSAFYPHVVGQSTATAPPICLSSLTVMNENVEFDPLGENNILDKHITEASCITLPRKDNIFSLEFSVLEYTNPKRIVYEYMMEGFEKVWHRTSSEQRNATYTNLPSGRYTMKLKAFYDGNPESASFREITLRILPPWYMTFQAWLFYVAAAALAICAWRKYRKHRIKVRETQEVHNEIQAEPVAAEETKQSSDDLEYADVAETAYRTRQTKSRRSIILVDGDGGTNAQLRIELQDTYNVTVCSNGKDAWAKICTGVPDLVITDLIMDKMDGAELCQKIKKNPGTNHIPVILLTPSDDERTQQRCITSGADRYFTKPVSMEILKSSIANVISTRETIRNKFSKDINYGYDDIQITSIDDQLTTKVISIIRKNIENTEFSVEELSREIGMSRVHLNRKLKETMNISPSNLIRSIRLRQAAYLLINNKVNVSEVAYRVGFSTHSYFSHSFHDYFGMTPKEFVARYMDCKDEDTLKNLFG